MNANIFMLFDCFLVEDQYVEGYGASIGEGDGDSWSEGMGEGYGYSSGDGWGDGNGNSSGVGTGDGDGDGEGGGDGSAEEVGGYNLIVDNHSTLCLIEIRSSSNEC